MKYSIDTSAFIEGWNHLLPPDVVPGLWPKLAELAESGIMIASEEVLEELKHKQDDLYEWAEKLNMYMPTTPAIQEQVTHIVDTYPKLVRPHSIRAMADPCVIALATVEGCSVVTEERLKSAINPRIPDVCNSERVRWINVVQLCREQGWSFK